MGVMESRPGIPANRIRKRAAALLLAAGMAFIPALPSGTVHAAGGIDVEEGCSITFQLDADAAGGYVTAQKALAAYLEANPEEALTVRLYRIASVTESGSYVLEGAYAGVAGLAGIEKVDEDTVAAEWEVFAKAAHNEVSAGGHAADADIQIRHGDLQNGGHKVSGLETGLYLVAIDTFEASDRGYVFVPYLAALPGYGDGGGYDYDIVSGMKPALDGRDGDLCIVKRLPECRTEIAGTTFVFEVTVERDGKVLYNDVFSMVFDEHGTQQVYVSNLPADATVTVEEVYSGGPYDANGETKKTAVMISGGTAYVEFQNDYNEDAPRPGASAVNHMTVEKAGDGTMGLKWESLKSSTGRVNGLPAAQ